MIERVTTKSFCSYFITCLCTVFAVASSSFAQQPPAGQSHDLSVKFATYQDSEMDLEVKVRGGMIRISRNWRGDTHTWTFDPQRKDLELSSETEGQAFGHALAKQISRGPRKMEQVNGQTGFYQRVAETSSGGVSAAPPTSNTTQFLSQHPGVLHCSSEGASQGEIIVVNAAGYKWVERVTRQWAQYNFEGRLLSWGEGNFRIGQVLRDANGRVRGYADTNDDEVITFSWDTQGRLEEIRDYTNRSYHYDYNSAGLLELVTDPDGVLTRYVYSGDQITEIVVGSLAGVSSGFEASNQASTTLIYSDENILSVLRDQDQKEVVFTYDYDKPHGLYTKTETASGNRITRWTWDIESNLISVQKNGEYELRMDKVCEDTVIIDRSNRLTYIDRDAIGFVKHIYHPHGGVTSYQNSQQSWPELNQVWSPSSQTAPWGITGITMPSGATIDYVRNSKGKPVSALHTENGESKQWRYAYDAYGNLTEQRLLEGSAPNNAVDRFDTWHYDQKGNIDYYEDSMQRRWLYEHNSRGDQTKVTDPSGKIWRYFYNGKGQLVRELDPIGYERIFEYSNRGLLLNIRDRYDLGQEALTRYKYNYRSLVTELTDPLGNVWSYDYNDSGEVEIETDPEQKHTSYTYDFRGRVKSVKDGNEVEIFYDYFDSAGEGLPPQTSLPYQAFERITYPTMVEENHHDLLGRTVRIVRRPNQGAEQAIIYYWNLDSRLTAVHRPDGQVVNYTWDVLGRPLTRTEPGVGTYSWEYPHGVRTTRYVDPIGGVVEKHYNPAGDVLSEMRADGSQVGFTYNANGQLYEFTNSRGNRQRYLYNDAGDLSEQRIYATPLGTTPVKTVTFSRNLRGDYLGYSDGATTQTQTVDKLGRVLTRVRNFGPFTKSFDYTYSPNGNVATHTAVSGVQLTYMWDPADNFQGVVIPGEGSISLAYNQENWVDPVSITFPGGAKQTVTYDGLRRIARLTSKDQAENTLMDNVYTYQSGPLSDGLVDTVTTEHGLYDYEYDSAYRLTSVSSPVGNESWSYDGLGRRQPASGAAWSYNANGAPLSTGTSTYTYDADGNRATKSDSVTTNYTYDESNRLVRVERPAGNVIARYGYDPMGERLWKENGAGQRTYYEYNDDGIEAELDSSGNVTKSYVLAPGSDWGSNPLAMKQGSSYSYFHNDHQGRPVKLTNNVGAATWSGRYSGYGVATVTSTGAVNPLRAAGQYSDPETGLYNNFQRNYDPELGVYLEEDPYGVELTGPNRYLYVNGEPIIGTDPTGEFLPLLWAAAEYAFMVARPWIVRGAIAAATFVTTNLLRRKAVQEAAQFGYDEVTSDYPTKRCIDGFGDPCRAGMVPDACYESLMTHGPGWAMRPLKRLFNKWFPKPGFPGMGVTDRAARRKILRDAGIPKNAQLKRVKPPHWKVQKKGYRQYVVRDPKTGKDKLLTMHPADANHEKPHWHWADADELGRQNDYGFYKYDDGGTVHEFDP